MRAALALVVLLLLAGSLRAQSTPPATVTLYRCTDSSGKVSYASTPCAAGAKQEVRTLARPVDAPPPPAAPPAPPTPAPAPPMQTRTVYLVPPKPMFECTTPDGKRYTSDDDRGNPRWVPLWTLGYPTVRPTSSLGSNIGHPERVMHPHPRDVHWPVASGGGRWIRDDCALLPPADACARLRDRRDAIRTRFFNAQEKERDTLRIEERSVNARLDNDCGGH
ncbi:MAG TPA: DUF4124 domain-containing protein [Thermomonas sp.]|uniref:DUF4124 domain-containing protein n=1 Tax=Thermomonas sp. TaxID=1971895 RepID=UPI002BA015E1|nr:DUF4124 domain-containing protein [Thermomonas sp.]HOV96467.1 DUF4124 domain-containing protein [Thermomonas sp.]